MDITRDVRLFRNGRNQAVRIPREFELPGDTAVMRKDGDRLIIEAKHRRQNLLDVLATLVPGEHVLAPPADPPPAAVAFP